MKQPIRRIDRQLARGEAAIAAARSVDHDRGRGHQAALRNLTNLDFDWANLVLERMEWADSFLQKGTLWLAFFGASLSTYDEKHIAIDVMPRLAPPRGKQLLRAIVCIFSAVTCFYLGACSGSRSSTTPWRFPLEYSVLGPTDEMIHICEASAQILADASLSRPSIFCAIRSGLEVFGARCPPRTSRFSSSSRRCSSSCPFASSAARSRRAPPFIKGPDASEEEGEG